ncbi:MAG: NAD(P)H-dependent oxidoreductase [Planctomycetes bacterium]|nr:NAD(P)H-dependent oxidoreductase [Planctomycetota bacterium]
MDAIPIGVLVGSARTGSFTRIVAETVMGLMPDRFHLSQLDIADLPIYNQDYDDVGPLPDSYRDFRRRVAACAGYLFVTPEYNRSVPALLKNALDVASRPMGSNAWSGKPGAVVSVSPGGMGAFGANHALRQSMVFLNVFMMQQPEAYVSHVTTMIGTDGTIADEKSLAFLQTVADGFAAWLDRFRPRPATSSSILTR